MAIAVLFGLVAALCYGTSNFVARISGKSGGVLPTLVWSQILLFFVATVVSFYFKSWPQGSHREYMFASASAVAIVVGTGCLYRAVATGRLTVVVPIMSAYGAVTGLLAMTTGEPPTSLTFAGLTLTVVGAILSAVQSEPKGRGTSSGLSFALGSALLFGFGYWLQGTFVLPAFGPGPTIWLYYLHAAILFTLTAIVIRRPLFTFDGSRQIGALVLTALLSGSGFVATMLALKGGDVAIGSAVSSTSTAVSALLGFLWLKERPGLAGWVGMMSVVVGVIILQIASA